MVLYIILAIVVYKIATVLLDRGSLFLYLQVRTDVVQSFQDMKAFSLMIKIVHAGT